MFFLQQEVVCIALYVSAVRKEMLEKWIAQTCACLTFSHPCREAADKSAWTSNLEIFPRPYNHGSAPLLAACLQSSSGVGSLVLGLGASVPVLPVLQLSLFYTEPQGWAHEGGSIVCFLAGSYSRASSSFTPSG